jgi:hypothetical protein
MVGSADRSNGDAASHGPRLSHGSPKPGEEAEEKTVLTTFPQNAAPVKSSHTVLHLGSKPSAAPKQEATQTGTATATADMQSASSKTEVNTSSAPNSMSLKDLLVRTFDKTISSFERKGGVDNYAAECVQRIENKRKCDEAALDDLRRDMKRFAREKIGAGERPSVAAFVLEMQRAYGPQICLGLELTDGLPFMQPPKKLTEANGLVTSVRSDEVSQAVIAIYDKVLVDELEVSKFDI